MHNDLISAGKVGTLVKPNVLAGAGAATTAELDMETCRASTLMLVLDAGNAAHDITTMSLTDCDVSGGTFAAVSPAVTITNLEGDGAATGVTDHGDGEAYLVNVPNHKRYVKLTWTDAGGAGSYFAAFLIGRAPVHKPCNDYSAVV